MSHPLGTDYDPPDEPIPPQVIRVLKVVALIIGGVVLVSACFMCAALRLLPGQAGCP